MHEEQGPRSELGGVFAEWDKTPDPRRKARKRRRGEKSAEEKKADRDVALAARQEKQDNLRTVTHTVHVAEALQVGKPQERLRSVVYEWRPGELVRVDVVREPWLPPGELSIVSALPVEEVAEGGTGLAAVVDRHGAGFV